MSAKLRQVAATINGLAKQEYDSRRKLCIAIAAAMELVKKESNLSWREWADENLRKPDGSKWSQWTLYSYASYGRNPKKLKHSRVSIAEHGRRARRALNPKLRQRTEVSGDRIQIEYDRLMYAWNSASPEARKRFLEQIEKAA